MRCHKNIVDACLRDYKKGLPVPGISMRRGVSIASIYKWVAEKGIKLRGWETADEVKKKAVADYKNNVTLETIARRYGISKTSIYRWTKAKNEHKYDAKKQRKVLADYVLGLPIEDLLEKHAINKKTLIKWRADFGIPSLRRKDYH